MHKHFSKTVVPSKIISSTSIHTINNNKLKNINQKQFPLSLLLSNQHCWKNYNKRHFTTTSSFNKENQEENIKRKEEKEEEEEKENFYSKTRGHYVLDRYSFLYSHLYSSMNRNNQEVDSQWKLLLFVFSIYGIYTLISIYFKDKFIRRNYKLFKTEFIVELTKEEDELKKEISNISRIIRNKKDCKEVFDEVFLRNLLSLCSNMEVKNFILSVYAKNLLKLMITDGSLRLKKFIYNYLLNEYNNLNNSDKFNYFKQLMNETNTINDYKAVEKLFDLQLIYFNLPEFKYLDLSKKEEQFKKDFPKIHDLLVKLYLNCKNEKYKSVMLQKFEDAKQRNLNLQNFVMLQLNNNYSILKDKDLLLKVGLFICCVAPGYYFLRRKSFQKSLLATLVFTGTYGYFFKEQECWNKLIDYLVERNEKLTIDESLQRKNTISHLQELLFGCLFVLSAFYSGAIGCLVAYVGADLSNSYKFPLDK
ncbi:hypothetical protein ABK040_014512 [Willaertia magna]